MKKNQLKSLKTKTATPIFDQHIAKIIKLTFKFSDFLSIHQKSAYSIDSFLTYGQF